MTHSDTEHVGIATRLLATAASLRKRARYPQTRLDAECRDKLRRLATRLVELAVELGAKGVVDIHSGALRHGR